MRGDELTIRAKAGAPATKVIMITPLELDVKVGSADVDHCLSGQTSPQ
jgi:hypothetical protein